MKIVENCSANCWGFWNGRVISTTNKEIYKRQSKYGSKID